MYGNRSVHTPGSVAVKVDVAVSGCAWLSAINRGTSLCTHLPHWFRILGWGSTLPLGKRRGTGAVIGRLRDRP